MEDAIINLGRATLKTVILLSLGKMPSFFELDFWENDLQRSFPSK